MQGLRTGTQGARRVSPSATGGLTLALAMLATPAMAQVNRTDDNAVTSADDAFGQSVGNERGGLYGADDVRGFSPVEAGNGRINGLYFAQASMPFPAT